jgi:prepilin-type N-terminal cleavage/methylation domain-containing protein
MSDSGFTLIEILVAMVLLGFAVLGAQAVLTDRLIGDVGREDTRATGRQLVEDRLQLVHVEPSYTELEARFEAAEDSVPLYPGYRRQTYVEVETGHTVVTVEVVTPIWSDTVRGTAVIGAP